MRHRHYPHSQEPRLCARHKVGVLFLSCGHSPHRRAMWRRKWSSTERLRPHCCSRQPPTRRRLNVCSWFRLRFKLHSAGRWDRSSPSRSLSAQFSLSNSSLAVTSRGSRFCEPSRSFARRGAFFEELAVSSQKLRGSGRNLRVFLPKVRRCFPPPRPFSAQRVAVCKKIPRCLPDSGGMSFATRTTGRVARIGFSTWRRWGAIA